MKCLYDLRVCLFELLGSFSAWKSKKLKQTVNFLRSFRKAKSLEKLTLYEKLKNLSLES